MKKRPLIVVAVVAGLCVLAFISGGSETCEIEFVGPIDRARIVVELSDSAAVRDIYVWRADGTPLWRYRNYTFGRLEIPYGAKYHSIEWAIVGGQAYPPKKDADPIATGNELCVVVEYERYHPYLDIVPPSSHTETALFHVRDREFLPRGRVPIATLEKFPF